MNRPLSRQALALWLTGLVVVALLALLVHWGLAPSLAPQRGAVPVVALPADPPAGRGASSPALPEVQRVALDPEGLSEVVVRNVEGQFLEAEAEAGGRRIRIRGSGWIPASSGAVTVSAAGYVPATVALSDAKVEVVLRAAYRVEGTISDVVTKERLSGVLVSLEARDARDAPLVGETDDEGRFRFAAVARGSYVLRGEPVGHVPLCADPGAESSGIGVEVVDNLQLDVPAYPVYVTLCGIHNQTNLTDAVFGALVNCTFRKQPGPGLPHWFDREVTKKISEVASALRIANAYGQACWSLVAPDSLLGQIEFVFDGDQTRIAKDVVFQPLAEFLRRPAPVWHSLERTFAIGTLTVESPIPLRIAARAGIVFGGIETVPGSFPVDLPHGNYVVGPLDMHPLLDPEQWTKFVSVPGPGRVTISPAGGLATLEFVGGSEWPRGVLCCSRPGFAMGVPLRNLPVAMPASPGSYEFSVLPESGSAGPPVWQRVITLEAGQRKVVRIRSE